MSAFYIRSRAEFFQVLEQCIAVATQKNRESSFWVFDSILKQLQAIREWTANGRTPTEEERSELTMGYYAVREFDDEIDGEFGEFLEWVVQLAGYFEEWPEDDDPMVEPDIDGDANGES